MDLKSIVAPTQEEESSLVLRPPSFQGSDSGKNQRSGESYYTPPSNASSPAAEEDQNDASPRSPALSQRATDDYQSFTTGTEQRYSRMRASDGMIDTHISKSPGSNRRFAHILSEQRRRENINGGFLELKSSIPQCRGSQDSKAVILKKAVNYIGSLEHELKRLKSELYSNSPPRNSVSMPIHLHPQHEMSSTPSVHHHTLLPPPPIPQSAHHMHQPAQMYVYTTSIPPSSLAPSSLPPSPGMSAMPPSQMPGNYYVSYTAPAQAQYGIAMQPRMLSEWNIPGTV
ncbi:uncharacterized protein V1518DRAFT_409624 [Limtongia smithiae]|uniref:uncharacterized protein n=1 Tax=Limtongia smithiae TaxID=1125753 RepID=UPI0034CF3D51